MAWNPSPEVRVCRDAATQLGVMAKSEVVMCAVLYITRDEKVGVVTYGLNSALCGEAKKWGDSLNAATMNHWDDK